MTEFNDMQKIKRRFFAMRNGVIADTMRKAGAPYPIVFGLNLPQIKEIAEWFGKDAEMARRLWADVRCRESLMLAPYLIPEGALSTDEMLAMVDTAPSQEAIDFLVLAYMKRDAAAPGLVQLLAENADNTKRLYAAFRLALSLPPQSGELEKLEALAEDQLGRGVRELAQISRQVVREISDRREFGI